MANDADLGLSPPKPANADPERTTTVGLRFQLDDRLLPPGTILTRQYKGETLQVKVLPHGFEFEGELFKSLSAAAKAITG